jgi:hypothetical protein
MTNRILAEVDAEIEKLTKIRTLLSSNLHTGSTKIEHRSRPVLVKPSKGKGHHAATMRHISAAGRERIAAAARKRWAAVRKQKRAAA